MPARTCGGSRPFRSTSMQWGDTSERRRSMPARVSRESLAPAEPAAPDPAQRRSDLSLCATLLSLFDFSAQGFVTRGDWDRGLSTLLLGGLSEDEGLWQRLLEMYDPLNKGAVQLEKVRDVLPIDPRISVLLQQLVHSVAGCREYVAAATRKQEREVEMRSQRAVINLRKRLMQPIFEGWRAAIRADKQLKARAARHMRFAGIGRAWRTWRTALEADAMVSKRRWRLERCLRRMQQRETVRAFNEWVDAWVSRSACFASRARRWWPRLARVEHVGGGRRGAGAAEAAARARPAGRHPRVQLAPRARRRAAARAASASAPLAAPSSAHSAPGWRAWAIAGRWRASRGGWSTAASIGRGRGGSSSSTSARRSPSLRGG